MHAKFPSDLELRTEFKRLKNTIGEVAAVYLTHKLWGELTYQAKSHGVAGLFDIKDRYFFESVASKGGVNDPLTALLESGFLIPHGDHWCSPMFTELNEGMDFARLKPSRTGERDFHRKRGEDEDRSANLLAQLPPSAWTRGDGSTATPEAMRRALTLICFLDGLCGAPSRAAKEFTAGLVQSAVAVCDRYPKDKLVAVELRLHELRKQKGVYRWRDSEQILRDFDSVVLQCYPPEGYLTSVEKKTPRD